MAIINVLEETIKKHTRRYKAYIYGKKLGKVQGFEIGYRMGFADGVREKRASKGRRNIEGYFDRPLINRDNNIQNEE